MGRHVDDRGGLDKDIKSTNGPQNIPVLLKSEDQEMISQMSSHFRLVAYLAVKNHM